MAERSDVVLENCEARAEKNPSFEIPPTGRRSLRPGDLAKIVVVKVGRTDVGERIWVMVRVAFSLGHYLGQVESEPVISSLRKGDMVRFGPEHVCDMERAGTRCQGGES